MLNVTVVGPTFPGFVRVFPCVLQSSPTSNVNFTIGQTVANGVITGLSSTGGVCFYTSATAELVVDVTGAFP